MTEPASTQNQHATPTNPSQESLQLARRFSKAIEEFNWTVDYVKFCELLELEPSEYADQQYQYFQQLAEALTRFDAEARTSVGQIQKVKSQLRGMSRQSSDFIYSKCLVRRLFLHDTK